MIVGLTPSQEEIVKAILKNFRGQVILFGSRAPGRHPRPDSDLDLCLKHESGKVPLLELGALREKFERSDLPFRVDLVDYADMNEQFREAVEREGVGIG